MRATKVGMAFVAVCAAIVSQASTWTIYPGAHKPVKDGAEIGEVEMSGPQQLTNAFTQLAAGDTVLVQPGTYDFSGVHMTSRMVASKSTVYGHLTTSKNFTLKGDTTGHWDDAVVFTRSAANESGATSRCFDLNGTKTAYQVISGVTFEGFDGGKGTSSGSEHNGRGGAILFADGRDYSYRQYATNCVFRNCKSHTAGAVDLGMVIDCFMTNCTAIGGSNGGVSNCRVKGCYFKDCSGQGSGGAAACFGVWDTTFEGCSATANGGAISTGTLDLPISNCVFRANHCTQHGGALYVGADPGKFKFNQMLCDCVFEDNYCSESGKAGGAVYYNENATTAKGFLRCAFSRNKNLDGSSGALYINASQNVTDCVFSNNVAKSGSGACTVPTGSGGVFSGCAFVGNTNLTSNGGGLTFGGSTSGLVTNCVFVGNVATNTASGMGRGAGLYVEPELNVPVVDCVFSNNLAYYGGAYAGNANVSKCTFVSNSCTAVGGAFFGMRGRVDDSVFEGNFATNPAASTATLCRGGAILISKTGYKFPIEGCTFKGNYAVGGGAVIDGAISNCTFFGNYLVRGPNAGSAPWNSVAPVGGAVLFISANGWVRNSSFVSNSIPAACESGTGGAVAAWDNSARTFVADSVFTNNFSFGNGGACARIAATNCLFVGNCTRTHGAGLSEASAYNCTFINQTRKFFNELTQKWEEHNEHGGTDAFNSFLEKCDSNVGEVMGCTCVACTFHDAKGICVFYEHNFATNCLIYNCQPTEAMFYRYLYSPYFVNHDYRGSVTGKIVNCTFADNTLPNTKTKSGSVYQLTGLIGKPGGGNNPDKDRTPIPDEELKQPLDFVNCIFYNNKRKNGTPADISGGNTSGPTFSHCLYGACDNTLVLNDQPGWQDLGGNIAGKDPRFVGASSATLGVPPYTIRRSSPACDAGDPAAVAGVPKDLAGNDRFRSDGSVDMGAYECWLRLPGTLLMIK